MSSKPLSHDLSAASWRSAHSNQHEVFHFFEKVALFVIEPLEIHELSQQLNWRLRAPFLSFRHVDIVYYHYQILARRCNQLNLPLVPLLGQFEFNVVLDLLATSLAGKRHFNFAKVRRI